MMPYNYSDVFYHYTTQTGLEGILRSGGLRAAYRMTMNDPGEFEYARRVVFEALNKVSQSNNLAPVAQSIAIYTLRNLEQLLNNTLQMSSSFCACFTASPDHPKQWERYADDGKGFAIGFNLSKILINQFPAVQNGNPFIFCAPVTYNESGQRELVIRLIETGISDLQTFTSKCSQQSADLTSLRDRITEEIVDDLIVLIDFFKAPIYSSEQEIRLILDPNDGTLNAPNIQHYRSNQESIPYIFMDLCSQMTKRLPLKDIKVGPNASFDKNKNFVDNLLDELGYGSNYMDRPEITKSYVVI